MKSHRRAIEATTFSSVIDSILEHENQHHRCFALLDFARDIDETYRNIQGKVKLYKWTSLILVTSIPILSTLLSLLLTGNQDGKGLFSLSPTWSIYLSLSLTLLTLLNSIFNPGERFKRVCVLGIGIGNLKRQAAEQLEAISSGGTVSHKDVHVVVDKLNKELTYYRRQLIDLFLPEMQVKTSKIVNDSFLARLVSAAEPGKTPERAKTPETGTGAAGATTGRAIPVKA